MNSLVRHEIAWVVGDEYTPGVRLLLDIPVGWNESVQLRSAAMTVRESRFIHWSHLVIADDNGSVGHRVADEHTADTALGWPVRIARV